MRGGSNSTSTRTALRIPLDADCKIFICKRAGERRRNDFVGVWRSKNSSLFVFSPKANGSLLTGAARVFAAPVLYIRRPF